MFTVCIKFALRVCVCVPPTNTGNGELTIEEIREALMRRGLSSKLAEPIVRDLDVNDVSNAASTPLLHHHHY